VWPELKAIYAAIPTNYLWRYSVTTAAPVYRNDQLSATVVAFKIN
jgi:hypothetical protein